MKVLFLARKFSDGDDVSEYVKYLTETLVQKGHEATVLAFDDGSHFSVHEDVDVVRTDLHYEGDSLYSWSMMLNNEMKQIAREIIEDEGYDVVHANDWLTVPGATALREHLEVPFVLTVHSTENERGFSDPNSPVISELEWKGCNKADKVLVHSEDTFNSLIHDLDVSEEKILFEEAISESWPETALNTYSELTKSEIEVKAS